MRWRRRRRITLGTLAALVITGAFAAGWMWSQRVHPAAARKADLEVVDAGRQAEALALLDQAAQAKHKERYDEALQFAFRARETDPRVRGVDVFVAEIALRRNEPGLFQQTIKSALRRGENEASARLLMAVDEWRSSASTSGQFEQTALNVVEKLNEASAAQLSQSSVKFFTAEILRQIGRPGDAHQHLLGSLHRQQPWLSAYVVAARMQVAAAEVRDGGANVSVSPPEPVGDALVALRRSLRTETNIVRAWNRLQGSLTAQQSVWVASDPALARFFAASPSSVADGVDLPKGDIAAPMPPY